MVRVGNRTLLIPLRAVCEHCRFFNNRLVCLLHRISRAYKPDHYLCSITSYDGPPNVALAAQEKRLGTVSCLSLNVNTSSVNLSCSPAVDIRGAGKVSLLTYDELIGFTTAMAVVITLSLLINCLIIGTFIVTPSLRRCPLNYFAINLAISDILIAFLLEPTWIVIIWNHHFILAWGSPFMVRDKSVIVEEIWGVFDLAFLVTSLMNIAALSLERCFVVLVPHWYRNHVTIKATKFLLVVPWCYGFIVAGLDRSVAKWRLVPSLFEYRLLVIGVGFGIPTALITCSYILISCGIWRRPISGRKHDSALAFRILLVVSVFFVCWSPFFGWFLVAAGTRNLEMENNYPVASALKMISYLNPLLNPILYVMVRVSFRSSVTLLIKKCKKKLFRSQIERHRRTSESTRTRTRTRTTTTMDL